MNVTRHRIVAIFVGSGIGIAALVGTAAQADAQPIKESTIKSECKQAGGSYTTVKKEGTRFSTCSYKDNEGNGYVDYYADGDYYSTHPA